MRFRRNIAIAAGFVLGLAINADPAFAQQALTPGFLPANELQLQNYSAEFPPLGASYSWTRPDVLASYMARQLRDMPDALETFETVVLMERADLVAQALGRIIRDRPEEAASAFGILARRNIFRYPAGPLALSEPPPENPLPGLVADARRQLARLTPAAAAQLELAIVFVEPETSSPAPNMRRADALRALIAKYPGTDAALEAEVNLLTSTTANREAWIQPLEQFAKQHPGTAAAAKALSEKAKALSEKAMQTARNLNLRNQDPTDAYLEVLAIVADLRSGRYPANWWSARAPWLAIELSPSNPWITAGNAERLLAGYIDFVKANFTFPADSQLAEGVNGVVTYQIFQLYERTGEGIAGVERTLTELERIDATRARYVRGAFYVNRLTDATATTRPALVQKAIDALSDARSGAGLYSRRALATLASLHYAESDFKAARAAFAEYLAANPDTPWSWVAAIRLGQCSQLLGDLDQAVKEFRAAATRYASVTLARQLGHAFAGRASEARSRFDEAAVEYQQALDQWGDLRRTARMEYYGRPNPEAWTYVDVQGLALKTRLDELRASLAAAEGAQLERGRWLLTSEDHVGALGALETFVRLYPKSTLAPDARRLLRRTRLEMALEQAGPANTPRDEAGAITALTAVDDQPWDEVAGVTKIVAATLTFRRGLRDQANTMMAAAIRDWQDNQITAGASTLPIAIADDVAAIRGQIFALESPDAWWRSSFEWRRTADPVAVFNPHITVQLFEGVPARETVYPASSPKSAIFMSSDAMELLVTALNALAEDVPEQRPLPRVPREMSDFVSAHLPAEMGMLCCQFSWFASVPNVQAVTFTNAERTRATASIRTFSSGGALLLEKTGGNWRVVGGGRTYVN